MTKSLGKPQVLIRNLCIFLVNSTLCFRQQVFVWIIRVLIYLSENTTLFHIDEDEEEVKVFPTIKSYTFELACRLFMTLEDPVQISELATLFNVFLKGIISIPVNLPGTRFYKAKKATSAIKNRLRTIARQRRAALEHKTAEPSQDLLSHLLATPDENGRFMSESVIVNNILMLLFAGHDTSSVAITMLMKNLAELPQVYENVLKGMCPILLHQFNSCNWYEPCVWWDLITTTEQIEIASSREGEEYLQWEDIQKMRYSWNVVCETMRLWPPIIGGFREALTDISYEGYHIPKGWKVLFIYFSFFFF